MQQVGDNRYGDIYAETYDALFQERDDLAVVSLKPTAARTLRSMRS